MVAQSEIVPPLEDDTSDTVPDSDGEKSAERILGGDDLKLELNSTLDDEEGSAVNSTNDGTDFLGDFLPEEQEFSGEVRSSTQEKYPRPPTRELFNPATLTEEQKEAIRAHRGELYNQGDWRGLLEYWNKAQAAGIGFKITDENREKLKTTINGYLGGLWQEAAKDDTGNKKMEAAQIIHFAGRLDLGLSVSDEQRRDLGDWATSFEHQGDTYLKYLINLKGIDKRYIDDSQERLRRWIERTDHDMSDVHAVTVRAAQLSRLVDPQSPAYATVKQFQQQAHEKVQTHLDASKGWDTRLQALDNKYNAGDDKRQLFQNQITASQTKQRQEKNSQKLIEHGFWSSELEQYAPAEIVMPVPAVKTEPVERNKTEEISQEPSEVIEGIPIQEIQYNASVPPPPVRESPSGGEDRQSNTDASERPQPAKKRREGVPVEEIYYNSSVPPPPVQESLSGFESKQSGAEASEKPSSAKKRRIIPSREVPQDESVATSKKVKKSRAPNVAKKTPLKVQAKVRKRKKISLRNDAQATD